MQKSAKSKHAGESGGREGGGKGVKEVGRGERGRREGGGGGGEARMEKGSEEGY